MTVRDGAKPRSPSICDWVSGAIAALREEAAAIPPTPIIKLELNCSVPATILIKDESRLPTKSLKHRVGRALFEFGLCNGYIGPNTHVVEASSGSAAISEAYFARLLDLEFTAIVPASTAQAKVEAITALGGNVEFSKPGQDIALAAANLAESRGYLFLNQFLNAERASCWRTNSNVASELFTQLEESGEDPPTWIVVGAGTGGTSCSIARHLRHRSVWGRTKLCVVDPEGSIFFRQFANPDCAPGGTNSDFIEGIGRKRPSPSFSPSLVDRMVEISDAAAIGASLWLRESRKLNFGPSTGANLIGALALAAETSAHEREPNILLLAGDAGERYDTTIYCEAWLAEQDIDPAVWIDRCEIFAAAGHFDCDELRQIRRFRGPVDRFTSGPVP